MKVGVLSLQGSFAEHGKVLDLLHVEYQWVRSLVDLKEITHLIIPGGESTTMEKLLKEFGMWEEIQLRITSSTLRDEPSCSDSNENGQLRIFGTCAGAILCEKLGANITIDRNAYGAQQDSFVVDLISQKFKNLKGVFIRAPRIQSLTSNSSPKGRGEPKVLAFYGKEPVLVEDGNFLIATFHPEILAETRIHEYFLGR